MLEERNAARLLRNYKEADSIRDELREMFNVLINDRESEWWVEQLGGRGTKRRILEGEEDTSEIDGDEDTEVDDYSIVDESTEFSGVDQLTDSNNLEQLTVVELKEKLREVGLPVSGKKAELIARLISSA